MDTSNQALVNIEPHNKLNYISVTNSENLIINNSQQPLKKIESNENKKSYIFNEEYDEDESKPKVRKRNPENWKQNVRKRNKNKGLEYIKANGEICEKKNLGPPCSCKEKCYMKIGIEACEKIFNNFWKLGDHALQNAYIAGCVRIFLPKHCNKKDGLPSRRFFSRNFHVTVNGVDTEVCKQAFLNMHAISNGRLDRLLKKKQEIGNTGFDERGKHSNKVNKIPIEKIRMVRKHIDSVREGAGYTGKRKPQKIEILPGVLNIRTMYRSYREEMRLKGLEPVCEYRYRKIFHSDFHLDFGRTAISNSSSSDIRRAQTQQKHSHGRPQLTSQSVTQSTRLEDEMCQRNNIKKIETFTNMTLQDMNINIQINTNLKPHKQLPVYSQLGTQESKDFQIREADSTPYVIAQEVFRLDYPTNYNNSQQSWIFPNQN